MVIVTISVPAGTSGIGLGDGLRRPKAPSFLLRRPASTPAPSRFGLAAGGGAEFRRLFSCFAGAVALAEIGSTLAIGQGWSRSGCVTATSAVPSGIRDLATRRALVGGLDFHRRLVGFFDLGDHVARLDRLAFLLQPFRKGLPFSMVGDSAGHQHLDWHGSRSRNSLWQAGKKARRSAIDVRCVKFGRIGFGGRACAEVGGAAFDDFPAPSASIAFNSCSLILARQQAGLRNLLDRVLVVAEPCRPPSRVRYFAGSEHRMSAVAVGLHFQDVGPLAGRGTMRPPCRPRPFTARTSMPSTCSPGILKETPRLEKNRSGADEAASPDVPMAVTIVLDDEDHRELPQLRHIETLIDLFPDSPRRRRNRARLTKIIAAIAIGESKSGAERHLRADQCRGRRRSSSPC